MAESMKRATVPTAELKAALPVKDTCVLSPTVGRRASEHSLLKCSPKVFQQVKELSERLNWLPIDVTNALLEFALARVEITMPNEC